MTAPTKEQVAAAEKLCETVWNQWTYPDAEDEVAALIAAKEAAEAERDKARAEVERLKPFEPMLLPSSSPADLRVACAKGFLSQLVLSFDAMNGDCNYSTTEITTHESNNAYEVTVRRKDKPTPNELRKRAEAERDRYKAALADLTTGTAPPAWGSADADDELGPVWREAQEQMTSRAAAALAAPAAEGGTE
jgi:hypothetical protein